MEGRKRPQKIFHDQSPWTNAARPGRNRTCDLLGPVVQSVVSLTSLLWVILLTVLVDSIYNILIFFCWKNVSSFCKSYSHFFSKKFQHICVSLNVNFNESLTNDIVSFEQLGPDLKLDRYLSRFQGKLELNKRDIKINNHAPCPCA